MPYLKVLGLDTLSMTSSVCYMITRARKSDGGFAKSLLPSHGMAPVLPSVGSSRLLYNRPLMHITGIWCCEYSPDYLRFKKSSCLPSTATHGPSCSVLLTRP